MCPRSVTLLVKLTYSEDLVWTFYDAFSEQQKFYNLIFKIVFLSSQFYIIYLMLNDFKPTHDPNIDTFKVQYLLGASAVLGLVFPYRYNPTEVRSISCSFPTTRRPAALGTLLSILPHTPAAFSKPYLGTLLQTSPC